jgi:hypothetical protein
MEKNDITKQWRANKIEQFQRIHTDALSFFLYLTGKAKEVKEYYINADPETWAEVEEKYHYRYIMREYGDSLFDEGLENPEDHPFADRKLLDYLQQKEDAQEFSKRNLYYGAYIAGQCMHFAKAFNEQFEKGKGMADFRQATEDIIDNLAEHSNMYIGYQFAQMEMKEKVKEQKKGSGKGQQDAKERRLKMLDGWIQPKIKGDEARPDKGEFYQALCQTFTGAEKTPRDRKTMKQYKENLESRNKIKIVWDNGTFIPE